MANQTQSRGASGILILTGIWLIIAPFILGYTNIQQAQWNDIVVGAVIAILAAARTFSGSLRAAWVSWLNAVLGFWLIIAPFVLGYPEPTPRWNDIILGIIIVVLGTWSATTNSTG